MLKEDDQRNKKGLDRTAKIGLAFVVVLLLALPAMALLVSFQNEDDVDIDYIDETGSQTGDMSMDASSRDAWENYLGSAPTIEFSIEGPDNSVRDLETDITYELPDLNGTDVQFKENEDNSKGDDGQYGGAGGNSDDRAEEPAADMDSEGDSGPEREVEESDIVKVIGDRMYVLNQYRGLVVVNIENTDDLYVEGSVQVLGHPISMYVVDFLGFVIVGSAPSLDGTESIPGVLYIIDLMDNSNPRVVQMVELTGYPVDSRRVGQVIYVTSNDYDHYYYGWNWGGIRGGGMLDVDIAMDDAVDSGVADSRIASEDDGPKTHITSVSFTDPLNIGEKDSVEISGNAGLIHASPFAIYVPQPNYDYSDPKTKFTYVDISDPKGDIKIRDDITVPGLLMDRYQMDHYRGTFRVVTQEWPSENWWSELPMSTLYVIDAREPDDLKRVSKLLIDDSGNLMATRFEGDRAYTIHLPRTIDPLDVIDLSDPADPKLTDILELPGWIEHMEVIGYNIIAIGVDDTSDSGRKVALSLFDVSDASNAVLKERIVIGDGSTYSSANYDPKALTILEDQEMVLIPFNSYDWNRWGGNINGVQIVNFDLDEGTLQKKGVISSTDNVERTRWVNGAVVTMSQRMVNSIDISDPDKPEVLDSVEITSNVVDAFFVDSTLITIVEPFWGESGGKIRIHSGIDPNTITAEYFPEGLEFSQILRDGDKVFVKGVRQGQNREPVSEVHMYDLSDPDSPVHSGPASVPIPDSEYYYEKYYDEEPMDGEEKENVSGEDDTSRPRVTHDPFTWEVLSDGSVVVYKWNHRYYGISYRNSIVVNLITWNSDGSHNIVSDEIPLKDHAQRIVGNEDGLIILTQSYWPPVTDIYRLVPEGDGFNMSFIDSITGGFIGASDDLGKLYTTVTFVRNETIHYNLNVYGLTISDVELLQSVSVGSPTSDVRFNGDSIVVISQAWDHWYGGYGYGYGYPEDDIVYDEETYADEGGSDAKETSSSGDQEPGSSDEYEREPYQEPEGTTIKLYKLENGLFGSSTSMEMEENVYASLVTEEFLVVNFGMSHTVISMVDGLEEIGTWFGNGWYRGGDMSDENLVIAMGMYGVEIRDL